MTVPSCCLQQQVLDDYCTIYPYPKYYVKETCERIKEETTPNHQDDAEPLHDRSFLCNEQKWDNTTCSHQSEYHSDKEDNQHLLPRLFHVCLLFPYVGVNNRILKSDSTRSAHALTDYHNKRIVAKKREKGNTISYFPEIVGRKTSFLRTVIAFPWTTSNRKRLAIVILAISKESR